MRRRISVVAGLLSLLFISGLTMALPLASAQPTTILVSMPNGAGNQSGAPGYAPDIITVVIGVNNTVVWANNDTVGHTVTSVSGNGSLASPHMNPNATYSYTFTTHGTYNYYCLYHAWMVGTVVVEAASSTVSTGTSSTTTSTAPEFPAASLAVIFLVVIAAAIFVAPHLRPTFSAGSGKATSKANGSPAAS
jgi:plastocyanin